MKLHKVPVPVWRYITALVRQEFPDTVFLLEGLGGSWEATEALLTVGGMQWAYSELFQNHEPGSIRWYLDVAMEISGHPDAINDCIRCTRAAGDVVMLGLPSGSSVTLHDFGQQIIFRALTLHAIAGREMYRTWDIMMDLLQRGLRTDFLVTSELPLSQLGEGYKRIAAGTEQKVVLYPSWDRGQGPMA